MFETNDKLKLLNDGNVMEFDDIPPFLIDGQKQQINPMV